MAAPSSLGHRVLELHALQEARPHAQQLPGLWASLFLSTAFEYEVLYCQEKALLRDIVQLALHCPDEGLLQYYHPLFIYAQLRRLLPGLGGPCRGVRGVALGRRRPGTDAESGRRTCHATRGKWGGLWGGG